MGATEIRGEDTQDEYRILAGKDQRHLVAPVLAHGDKEIDQKRSGVRLPPSLHEPFRLTLWMSICCVKNLLTRHQKAHHSMIHFGVVYCWDILRLIQITMFDFDFLEKGEASHFFFEINF